MKGEEQGAFGWGLGIKVQALNQEPRDNSKTPCLGITVQALTQEPRDNSKTPCLGITVQALTQESRDISKTPCPADSLSIPASEPPGLPTAFPVLPGHQDLASPEGSAPHPSPQIFLCKCLWLCSQILFSYTSSLI